MLSHIFKEAENICDRVVMIKEGKIIEDKDIKKIKNNRIKQYKIIFSFKK